ncbi:MAG: hypothetical protein GC193_05285 [Cryomorphaceae bacterium]|nr:hypothetical protein [Cryomorphaceae bacterium]
MKTQIESMQSAKAAIQSLLKAIDNFRFSEWGAINTDYLIGQLASVNLESPKFLVHLISQLLEDENLKKALTVADKMLLDRAVAAIENEDWQKLEFVIDDLDTRVDQFESPTEETAQDRVLTDKEKAELSMLAARDLCIAHFEQSADWYEEAFLGYVRTTLNTIAVEAAHINSMMRYIASLFITFAEEEQQSQLQEV